MGRQISPENFKIFRDSKNSPGSASRRFPGNTCAGFRGLRIYGVPLSHICQKPHRARAKVFSRSPDHDCIRFPEKFVKCASENVWRQSGGLKNSSFRSINRTMLNIVPDRYVLESGSGNFRLTQEMTVWKTVLYNSRNDGLEKPYSIRDLEYYCTLCCLEKYRKKLGTNCETFRHSDRIN